MYITFFVINQIKANHGNIKIYGDPKHDWFFLVVQNTQTLTSLYAESKSVISINTMPIKSL